MEARERSGRWRDSVELRRVRTTGSPGKGEGKARCGRVWPSVDNRKGEGKARWWANRAAACNRDALVGRAFCLSASLDLMSNFRGARVTLGSGGALPSRLGLVIYADCIACCMSPFAPQLPAGRAPAHQRYLRITQQAHEMFPPGCCRGARALIDQQPCAELCNGTSTS